MRVRLKRMAGYTTALWVLLLVFMSATDPFNTSAVFLMLPMALLFGALAGTVLVLQQVSGLSNSQDSAAKQLGFACLLAALPTSLLLLKSINQLTPKDLVLIGMLIAITFGYVRRFRFYQKME